ncbi:MAG: HAD hydrolase family protein [Gammaproteobacteria bacterium]|nr:HAD hydrolase family protein [Gammaproteobacteria bacterium]
MRRRAAAVRLALFDVDGVLTDGRLYLGAAGEELKVFHSRDGHGLVMLREHGIHVGVISGRSSPIVVQRMATLGVEIVEQGCHDKREALQRVLARTGCAPASTAFTGDDLPDLPVMAVVGLAVAVADAHPSVRERSHWCTRAPGGRGAVREVCDLLLAARGLPDADRA